MTYNDRSMIDDNFDNMEDVSETCDEGQRPHEALETVTSRDTPLKRNALAAKQKGTYRNSRRDSNKNSRKQTSSQQQLKSLIVENSNRRPEKQVNHSTDGAVGLDESRPHN